MLYKKVLAGDYNIRYIDNAGKWWKKQWNGKFTPSRSMEIKKEYGICELNIVDEGVFGLRTSSTEL